MKKNIAKINIVAAISKGKRALGKDNKLLWHLPADLQHFKQLTMGHPVIMGYKTYESIGRPLPGRTNIVITRDPQYPIKGYELVNSIDEAVRRARQIDEKEIFVIGGGETYKQALPLTDKLYLTLIDDEPEADTFFPDYSSFNKKIREERGEQNEIKYVWVELEKD